MVIKTPGSGLDLYPDPDWICIRIRIVLPEPLNNRGHLGLKKKDYDKVLNLKFVVIYCFDHFCSECTFFSNFLGSEACKGPSCFFKTLKVFDLTPLVA